MLMSLLATGAAQPPAPHSQELERLLEGVAAGDRESLAELYSRTRAAVYGLALSYLKHGQDAQDVTQDTFVRVWERAGQYRPQGKPMSWLLAIARNLALMKLRQARRTGDLEPEEWEALEAPAPAPVEDRHLLAWALNALADQERQIVVLHAVAGMRHREIAALLELPLATVLSKYHRALKKLKQQLKGDEAQ